MKSNILLPITLPVLALNLAAQVILAPGEDSYLDPVAGTGQGYVHVYHLPALPNDGSIIVLSAERDGRGYVHELVGGAQVMEMIWGFPVHAAYPQPLALDTWYYLRGADVSGATVLLTEPFLLDGPGVNPLLPGGPVIPEPADWAMVMAALMLSVAGGRELRREFRRL